MKIILLATAAALCTGTAALALTTDDIIDRLSAEGFTRIDVRSGPTQYKVEAIRGTTKVETVFDKVSGAIIDQEVEAVGVFENTSPGVRVRERNRDFVERDVDDDRADDRDDRDEDRNDRDDDRDDDSSDHGDDDRRDDGRNDGNRGGTGGGGDGRSGDDGDDD
jgi:hypothetical protein